MRRGDVISYLDARSALSRVCDIHGCAKYLLPDWSVTSDPQPARLNGNTFPAVGLPSAEARRCATNNIFSLLIIDLLGGSIGLR